MHEYYLAKLALLVVAVYLFCVFVVDNGGIWVAGAVLLGFGVYAAVAAVAGAQL